MHHLSFLSFIARTLVWDDDAKIVDDAHKYDKIIFFWLYHMWQRLWIISFFFFNNCPNTMIKNLLLRIGIQISPYHDDFRLKYISWRKLSFFFIMIIFYVVIIFHTQKSGQLGPHLHRKGEIFLSIILFLDWKEKSMCKEKIGHFKKSRKRKREKVLSFFTIIFFCAMQGFFYFGFVK